VRLIDISPEVTPELPGWPGDTRYGVERRWSMDAGDACTVSKVSMSPHLGAHVDAPLHFHRGGADAAALPLEPFIGPARVVQCGGIAAIGPDEALWAAGAERVLYRVLPEGAGEGFTDAFAPVTVEGARTLARLGVRLYGTDAPSVDPADSKGLEVHHVLREAGIQILEGLRLASVDAGEYELVALPLRWRGADASPVRAILRVR